MSGLFGSRVLETALGMASVYLLLAMFCSTANEWIAALFAVRAAMLEKILLRLLGGAARQFYRHPLIQATMHGESHPEHIPASTFAKTLIALATPNQSGAIEFEDLERGILSDLPPGTLRSCLLAILQGSEKRIDAAQAAIEKWFDEAMDAASRRYKRRAQRSITLLAVAVTIASNADTIRLMRGFLAGNQSNVTLGWSGITDPWPQILCGWMLTAAAVSLGAPFWFDVARNLTAATRTPRRAAPPFTR